MKRPDLRVPVAERSYPAVERPIMKRVEPGQGFGMRPTPHPCKECPLARTALPGALGGYTVAQYLEVMHGPADLACHMSPGFPSRRLEMRSCTGLAAYRANLGPLLLLRLADNSLKAALLVGPDRERVFRTAAEFSNHHGGRDGGR